MSSSGHERRLPVAGEGKPDSRPEPPPPPPNRFWHVVFPAIGAVTILTAGLVAQCFGGPG